MSFQVAHTITTWRFYSQLQIIKGFYYAYFIHYEHYPSKY